MRTGEAEAKGPEHRLGEVPVGDPRPAAEVHVTHIAGCEVLEVDRVWQLAEGVDAACQRGDDGVAAELPWVEGLDDAGD